MKKDYIVGLSEEEADELMDEHWVGELVRCRDCVNRHDSINCRMYSEGMDTSDDWFCADGEVKT
jgi:hypothetical protein